MKTKEEKYFKYISSNTFFIHTLDKIGLKNNYIGYYYLTEIINLLVNQNIEGASFYKNIYPLVAKTFNKSSCTVERDIRILINNCWNDKLKNNLKCNHMLRTPTCCQFIRLIRNYILSLLE